MDFLERQQITFFIITGLTELWSHTGPCFERRFDFVVGDIVDSTYLTDRFLRDGQNSVKVKINTLTPGQRCWKGVISDPLDLFWVRNEKNRLDKICGCHKMFFVTHSIGEFGISNNLIKVWSADVVFESSLLDKIDWMRAYENMVSFWIQSSLSFEKEGWDRSTYHHETCFRPGETSGFNKRWDLRKAAYPLIASRPARYSSAA